MKRLWKLSSYLLAVIALAGWTGLGVAAPVDDLVAAAKKEGVIEFYGPSTLGPEGAQALAEGFNKKYGLNIKLNFSPSGNMTRDTAKIVGMSASGHPPEWDVPKILSHLLRHGTKRNHFSLPEIAFVSIFG
jgi:hypothetical protein